MFVAMDGIPIAMASIRTTGAFGKARQHERVSLTVKLLDTVQIARSFKINICS